MGRELSHARRDAWVALLLVLFMVAALLAGVSAQPAEASTPYSIVDNGTIQVGVNAEGHLNVPGGTRSSGTGTTNVGLRFLPTNAEATAPGCLCEGWGAADAISSTTGYANVSVDGVVNMTVTTPPVVTADSVVTEVEIGSTLRVTHDYHPSTATNFLYEVTVTIENISASAIEPRYRRVMDWDIEPTAFSEYVTINSGTSTNLLYTSDNGFETANPLGSRSSIRFVGDAIDNGPYDHGALFDFGFDAIDPEESVQFNIYYGAAPTESDALAALGAVGAEVFSLGQSNTANGPTLGTPNTFIFAFSGVGGAPVIPPTGPSDNNAPVPDAGSDVFLGYSGAPISVALDGSGSFDPDGDPLTFTWVGGFVGGTTSGEHALATFDAPGTYVITLGVSDGVATSTDTVTVTIAETSVLGVANICPPSIPDAPFTDVSATNSHRADINCIYYHGITVGTSATTYTPAGDITRWQIALFVTRALTFAGTTLPAGADAGYGDIVGFPADHQKAINQMAELGLDRGATAVAWNPNGTLTRADMAWFLAGMLEATGMTMPPGTDQGFTDIGGLSGELQTDINQLAELGITIGRTATLFDPDDVVLRQESATFFARTLGLLTLVESG